MAKSQPGYYDMVLMDIQMPVLNGHDATVRIRQLPDKALSFMPIVALSANSFDEDRKEAEKHGMNGFISKPINMKEVMEALSSFLR
ncbi:MAG: response regulator [Selenomonadaceae bacterium]|nr:response regulator [Selenomonadaceae bacterium]